MNDIFLKLIRLRAKGFCCSQIVVILALEAQGKTNDDLVRSMAGLCFGLHRGDEVCGALAGGACLISLYAGKGNEGETADERYMTMMEELAAWFGDIAGQYGGSRCDQILEKFPDRSICGRIVGETYEKCMEILESHGFDPAVGRNG